MTTSALSPLTARDTLFPRRNVTDALSEALNHSDVSGQVSRAVKHLSGAGRLELLRRLADTAANMLDLDLVKLVMHTLRTYEALTAAADRTAAVPGSVEVVQLLSVPVPWRTQAVVQLWLNETPCLRIHFELEIVLDISVEATLRNGRLVALPSGRCTVSVTLSGQGVTLATNHTRFDLPTVLPLGNGILLTSAGLPQRPGHN